MGPLGQGLLDPSGIRVVGQLKQGLVSIAPSWIQKSQEGNMNAGIYQKYQNVAVRNQLTAQRGRENMLWVCSESVDV